MVLFKTQLPHVGSIIFDNKPKVFLQCFSQVACMVALTG